MKRPGTRKRVHVRLKQPCLTVTKARGCGCRNKSSIRPAGPPERPGQKPCPEAHRAYPLYAAHPVQGTDRNLPCISLYCAVTCSARAAHDITAPGCARNGQRAGARSVATGPHARPPPHRWVTEHAFTRFRRRRSSCPCGAISCPWAGCIGVSGECEGFSGASTLSRSGGRPQSDILRGFTAFRIDAAAPWEYI